MGGFLSLPRADTAPCGLSTGLQGSRRGWAAARALSGECRFVLDEDSYLVPELDGVRILSRTSHEFLHEIPGEAGQASPPSLGPFFRVSVYGGHEGGRAASMWLCPPPAPQVVAVLPPGLFPGPELRAGAVGEQVSGDVAELGQPHTWVFLPCLGRSQPGDLQDRLHGPRGPAAGGAEGV